MEKELVEKIKLLINKRKSLSKICEELELKDKMVYELILGMRKIKGVNIKKFEEKYHRNLLENSKIKEMLKNDDLIVDDSYLKIPYNKIYIQNEILEELLDYE